MGTKPFQLSLDTQCLVRLFENEANTPGAIVTYAQMSRELGRSVSGGTPEVQSALRHLTWKHGWIFGNERGTGYKHLTDPEIVRDAPRQRQQVRKKIKRAARRLQGVKDFNSLPQPEQLRHNAELSLLGALQLAAKAQNYKRVEAKVAEAKAVIPTAETLALFRG